MSPGSTELSDAEFVVVANRLPVDVEELPDGSQRWKQSPGGLVTAIAPMLRSREGAWVGWPGTPDVELDPFVDGGMQLHPVSMSEQEVEDYYEGFSNGTLWPLYHDVIVPPAFHRHWWQAYVKINQRFAHATAEVAAQGATVWVQDYQLQLLPAMLRELRPDLRIGFFLHIPFPPTELFMQLPWRRRIVEGLLGADLVGFHTPGGTRNFRLLAARLTDAHAGPGRNEVTFRDRVVKLGAFPISIDSKELDKLAA
jgi:trehalose 6-phosphate synthase